MPCPPPPLQKHSARGTASLLHGHINKILIFKPEFLCGVVRCNPLAIDHEANLRGLKPQARAIGIHEFPERSALLDLELDLTSLLILHLQLNVGTSGILSHGSEVAGTCLQGGKW